MDGALPARRIEEAGEIRLGSPRGRRVLAATVLASGASLLDLTVVNIATNTIGTQFHAALDSFQWILNGYTLTLAALLLLGGSLGDRYGRRLIFTVGIIWFAAASALCALAPDVRVLIAARALQGVGGALLTPGSLALIQASFHPDDRATAIGAWSGLGAISTAVGPFLGGWLAQAGLWRLIFLLNLPLSALVVWITVRHVPESRDPDAAPRIDLPGAALGAVGLAGVTFALTEIGHLPATLLALSAGVGAAALVAFLWLEATLPHPMLPLRIFRTRLFSATNAVTFVVYGALGGSLFLVPLELQRVLGYKPIQAGLSLIPITLLLVVVSPRAGRLATRVGPRPPMTAGPLLVAAGLILYERVGPGAGYLTEVLPAVLVFGTGLGLTVAPLTATVLGALPSSQAGIASAVNNQIARLAGLIAVATLPPAAGLLGADALAPGVFDAGFHRAILIAAALCALGGLLSFLTIPPVERAPVPATL